MLWIKGSPSLNLLPLHVLASLNPSDVSGFFLLSSPSTVSPPPPNSPSYSNSLL